jgi:hypothetical protein
MLAHVQTEPHVQSVKESAGVHVMLVNYDNNPCVFMAQLKRKRSREQAQITEDHKLESTKISSLWKCLRMVVVSKRLRLSMAKSCARDIGHMLTRILATAFSGTTMCIHHVILQPTGALLRSLFLPDFATS